MKERPILFSGPMVRALLDGRKTQTRRVVKLPAKGEYVRPDMGGWDASTIGGKGCYDKHGNAFAERPCVWNQTTGTTITPPYDPGDRLWVRETWTPGYYHDAEHEDGPKVSVIYDADKDERTCIAPSIELAQKWERAYSEDGDTPPPKRPSIHMPRWASRILLEITDVRVERLQDITGNDVEAEGVEFPDGISVERVLERWEPFRGLWNSINGPGSWDANPWVWVIEFKRVQPLTPGAGR